MVLFFRTVQPVTWMLFSLQQVTSCGNPFSMQGMLYSPTILLRPTHRATEISPPTCIIYFPCTNIFSRFPLHTPLTPWHLLGYPLPLRTALLISHKVYSLHILSGIPLFYLPAKSSLMNLRHMNTASDSRDTIRTLLDTNYSTARQAIIKTNSLIF